MEGEFKRVLRDLPVFWIFDHFNVVLDSVKGSRTHSRPVHERIVKGYAYSEKNVGRVEYQRWRQENDTESCVAFVTQNSPRT